MFCPCEGSKMSSIKVPAGHGQSALPISGKSRFKNNLPIVIRECLANAITYKAKHCHVVRVMHDGKLYLVFMHDGISFQGEVDEIKNLGLTPNKSGDEGWSFQGNGLTYCAAYLAGVHPKIIIASKKDGKLSVASATIDRMKNDWIISDEPEWGENLKKILGKKWYDKMNVFYLFRLPDSEMDGKESYGMKFNNILTYLAPSMVTKVYKEGGPPKITVSEGLFHIGKKDKSGGNEYKSLSDCKRGSWERNLVSPEEFSAKFCEHEWTFEAKMFTVNKNGFDLNIMAEITILGFPGIKSMNRSGTDNHQWLGNVRDGEFDGQQFKKGKGVGMGVPPNNLLYLYVPCIGDGNERFSRFKDNAVGFFTAPSAVFASLGLPYNDRRVGKGEPKPFGIIKVKIVSVDDKMRHSQTGEVEPVNPMVFADMFGRRPDFLFDLGASRDIINNAANAGCDNVPEDCRKWFVDHFPTNEEDCVPIVFCNRTIEETSDEYRIYDLKTGEKFSKLFHAGQNHALAIWSNRLGKFVTEVAVASITRGVEITRMPHQSLKMASADIQEGYQILHKSHVIRSKIDKNENMPFFNVTIDALSHRKEDGSWNPIGYCEYEHDVDYRPSRGVHGLINGNVNVRLGVVEEVPARQKRKGGNLRRRIGGNLGDIGDKKRQPYCERDGRIFVQWDNKDKFIKLNKANPTFGLHFMVPDEVGSPTQKILDDLYWMIQSIACGASCGVEEPTKYDPSPVTNEILNDDENPIYESNRWDYVVNKAIESFMGSSCVQDMLREVEKYRSKKIA